MFQTINLISYLTSKLSCWS